MFLRGKGNENANEISGYENVGELEITGGINIGNRNMEESKTVGVKCWWSSKVENSWNGGADYRSSLLTLDYN